MTTMLQKLPGRLNPVTENSMPLVGYDERRLRHLAREIAMDILELEDILRLNHVTPQEWESIKDTEQFKAILTREAESWNSALSTSERVKVKALAVVEDSLLAAQAVIHDPTEGAQGRARMLEAVAKIAQIGDKATIAGDGSKVMIQINMGADRQLMKEVTPEVTVIETEAADG